MVPHSFIRFSHVGGPEGVVESSRIAVYSVPCGLTWDADVALFFGEAEMEGVVERLTIAVSSVPCMLPWGADVALDLETLALWGVTD